MRALRRSGPEHIENPMNAHFHQEPERNTAQFDFPACKLDAILLQTQSETETELFLSSVTLDSPACSGVDDFSTHSLSRRSFAWAGSRAAALNRLWRLGRKPQDTGGYE